MKTEALPGHVAMLTANIIWGLMSPISKEAQTYFTQHDISRIVLPSLRMIGAAIAFWLLSLFVKKEKTTRHDRWCLFGAGLLSIAFNQNLYVVGISFTSPIDASVITTMLPMATMILAAIVIKEPITHLKALGIAVGMTGAILLILSSGQGLSLDKSHALGDLMCLTAQFSFACYLVFFKDVISKYSPVTLMKWMFLFATLVVLPFTGKFVAEVDYANLPLNIVGDICYVVFGATFFTFMLIPIGQRLLRPTVVSSYNYLQPVVATIAALAWGQSSFGWIKGLAVLLVFGGVLMVTKSKSRKQLEEEKALKSLAKNE